MKNQTKPESNQDAFNRVWQHFITEGNPQCEENGTCVYRSDDGKNGCAVGCMLPDDLAKKADAFAQANPRAARINMIIQFVPEVNEWFSKVSPNMLLALQRIHDSHGEAMERNFRGVAETYGLQIPT